MARTVMMKKTWSRWRVGRRATAYLTDRATGTVRMADESGCSYCASSWNSVTSLPSTMTSVERASCTFSMNGDCSRRRMKRVSAWMSTVLPTMRKRTVSRGTGGGAAWPFTLGAGASAGAAAADVETLVCAITVSQVYGGSDLLTSSMRCGQTKRLL